MKINSRLASGVGLTLLGMAIASAIIFSHGRGSAPECQYPCLAFSETFDSPAPTNSRSGDLNTLWGVSRINQGNHNDQFGSGQMTDCGNPIVQPDNDVRICNGQVAETVNDLDSGSELAMYPKQPFDFASRTGTVAFDVNADSEGGHAAWPTFMITDQPVSAPSDFADFGGLGIGTVPRNGVGFELSNTNHGGQDIGQCHDYSNDSAMVATIFQINNYAESFVPMAVHNCVLRPTTSTSLNHFEVRISTTHIEIWGTDPDSTVLKDLAGADINLAFSRGLIWMIDQHYHASKFNDQGVHTFVWDNVGFDGPNLPRDLTFDVPDRLVDQGANPNSTGGEIIDLGYFAPNSGTLSLTIPSVTNLPNATSSLVTFNFFPLGQHKVPSFRVNGNQWHNTVWPFTSGDAANQSYMWRTIAVSVPLTELHLGDNLIEFQTADPENGGTAIANIDLILVAAGSAVSTSTPTSTVSAIPTSTLSPPPTQTATAIVTLAPSTSTPMPTVVPPTSIPTALPTSTLCFLLKSNDDIHYTRINCP